MKIQSCCLVTGLVLAFASPVSAQGNDVTYCHALASKYQQYLAQGSGGRHGGADDQNVDARLAADKCKDGDTSGIPVLEHALKNAKIELPTRG
jgi:hypothetical protein